MKLTAQMITRTKVGRGGGRRDVTGSTTTVRQPGQGSKLDTIKQADAPAGSEREKSLRYLSGPQQDAVVEVVEKRSQHLCLEFVRHVYSVYYTDSEAAGRLDAGAGPPQPRGFPVKPFDPSIVDQVRRLGSGYRAV